MLPNPLPLKCKNMAEQDIREDQMTVTYSNVDYVRGLKGNNSVLVRPEDLMKQGYVYHRNLTLSAGEQYELPYSSGLIMIQNSSHTHDKAVATLFGGGSGTVIVPQGDINFFSEVSGKVCVFNTGTNTKYVVKNTKGSSTGVILTFIG